ncbi:MAG: MFS transporter [Planctomycetota bacterium]|nr:MFS transporter [Planctomycetota bacterium]
MSDHAQPEEHATASPLRVGSWVVYDLAGNVYSATVTFVLTSYAKEQLGGLTAYSVTHFLSMIVAGLLGPFLGALIDTTGRSNRYLTLSSAACVAALAGWGLDWGGAWLLACYFGANLSFNVALLFYNALITSAAPPDRVGRISGLGVGVGYLGTILVLAINQLYLPTPQTFFFVAAGMFLLFALPCMIWVRSARKPAFATRPNREIVREANKKLLQTIRSLPKYPALMWFLIGNFLLVDVLNTAVIYFADFTTDVFAAQAEEGITVFSRVYQGEAGIREFMQSAGLYLNIIALLIGVMIGRWIDLRPLSVMIVSAVALLGALVGGAVYGGTDAVGYLCTLVALGGFGLTGIWSAGRKVIVMLAPPEMLGQFFGLYSITAKLSVFGQLIYAVVHDAHGCKPAMLAQSAQLILGLCCLLKVRISAPAARGGEV